MRAMGGAQKLRFTVQSCSGEDSDYPARELLYHSPQTRGWQSPRFCKFPQELVLKLEKPARVQQIQILAHEFKIPTKIEVYVAPPGAEQPPDGGAPAASKRLGYLSFDSNERSGHQARELKSVHVSIDAAAIRLVVHRCHVNKLNIYNQVGVVALNLIGEPLSASHGPAAVGAGPAYLDAGGPPAESGYYNRAAAELADLTLDIHVDGATASKVRDLARLKEAAVAAEEYDEAKRLKAAIERLKALGGKIAQLEARKRAAVEREDYDLAKALKCDIDKLRAAGEGAALADGGMSGAGALVGKGGGAGDDVVGRMMGKARSMGHGGGGGGGGGGGMIGSMGAGGEGISHGDGGSESAAAMGRLPSAPLSPGGGGGGGGGGGAPGGEGSWGDADGGGGGGIAASVVRRNSGYYAYEERPAVARGALMRASEGGGGPGPGGGAFGDDDGGLADADPSAVSAAALFGSSGGGAGGAGGAVEAPPPPGWSKDLPPPEPIAGAAAKEAEVVGEIAGDYVAAAFFSRNWQLRDAGIAWVTDLVRNGKASGPERRDHARALARLAAKAMKDKVPNVFHSSVGLLTALLDGMAGGGRDVAAAVEQALPVLIERLGDSNARLRDGAREAILALARNRESGLRLAGGSAALLRPVKSQTAWRPVLGTLQLMQDLVPLIGVSQGGSAGGARGSVGGASAGGAAAQEGLDLAELMDYVGKAFGSANADVRGAAVKVAVLAHDAAGPAARRLLPRGVNPKITAQLDAALGVEAAPSPAPPQPQSSTPAPKSRAPAASKPAATPSSASKPAAARASAGGRGGGAAAARKQQPVPPHLQHSHDAGSSQKQQPAGRGPPAVQQEEVEALADDPAPFESELRSREKQYGGSHPAVAESCSNLAILYNQRGEYARAQPLYERALRIYEATYGPEHREVAHTLTDLAVLHLEQGHDEVGRPLLERALAMQERALGPDHPDVVAIRDVLDSE